MVFAGAAAGEMAAPHKLQVVHHPVRAKVVLVAHEALVQGQVRADRVLSPYRTVPCRAEKEHDDDGGGGQR